MLTKGKARCRTLPLCDIGLRSGLDWVFWPEKVVDWFNPEPMNQQLVYYRYKGYFRDLDRGRGNHTTIELCPMHYDMVVKDNEYLGLEEILLEEWCEAYYNRRRDRAREILHDRRGGRDVSPDSLDNQGVAQGREADWRET